MEKRIDTSPTPKATQKSTTPLTLGQAVHYVMPDLSCRAAFITGICDPNPITTESDTRFLVNLTVLYDCGKDTVTSGSNLFQYHAGVDRAHDIPAYVPYEKYDEANWNESEHTRFVNDTNKATTPEQKAAVLPVRPYTPNTSPEILTSLEAKHRKDYDKSWDDAQINTWHLMEDHHLLTDAIEARNIAKAEHEIDLAKARAENARK